MTSDVASLPFVARLVADSREVALHNITGLATPDQVQMALFALAHLMPDGAAHRAAVRAELTARHHALLAPLGVEPPGGHGRAVLRADRPGPGGDGPARRGRDDRARRRGRTRATSRCCSRATTAWW